MTGIKSALEFIFILCVKTDLHRAVMHGVEVKC